MSRWLPPELHCVIYSYVTDVDFIAYLLNSLNNREKARVQNCIVALLKSKQSIIPAYLDLFPNLSIVDVPVEIDKNTSGSGFARFPYLNIRYMDQYYLDGNIVSKFLSEYATDENLVNKVIKFNGSIGNKPSLIIAGEKVKIGGIISSLHLLYLLLYNYNSLRSLTTRLFRYEENVNLLFGLPLLEQIKFTSLNLTAGREKADTTFNKILLSPYLKSIVVKKIKRVMRGNISELLNAFIEKLDLNIVNANLIKFKIPLNLTKLQQIIDLLPNVQRFYLIWSFPKDNRDALPAFLVDHQNVFINIEFLPGYERFKDDIIKLNYNNITYDEVFVDAEYKKSLSKNQRKIVSKSKSIFP